MTKVLGMTTITRANGNFKSALDDVKALIRFHDSETGGGIGRPADELEVLKRAGVILAVTAWETFVEDTLEEQFDVRLRAAKVPKDIESTFNSVASAWLQRGPSKPEEVAQWTLDGWKTMIKNKVREDLSALNTPNSANVKALFKRYLGEDITKAWRWPGASSTKACNRLDTLIKLRGQLVHRGRPLFKGSRANVRRGEVTNAVDLLERLVDRTEAKLGVGPRKVVSTGS
jgi:hypothetical protein